MSPRLRWGVLSTASIAVNKVIPAMQRCGHAEIVAIASRDAARAREAASRLGISRAYGTYEELLAQPDIDVIYNPLPNHLHVPWSIRAAEAGRHVLCEKPLGLSVAEAKLLRDARDRTGVKIGEAFMIRTYPQWQRALALIASGRIGPLRSCSVFFSYFDSNPASIHNHLELGGGGLLDIGCYAVFAARHGFGRMPHRVSGCVDRDPHTGVDRLASAILDFGTGHAIFTCGTQLVPYQRVHFLGTRGRIELEIPFNAPPDQPLRLLLDEGGDVLGRDITVETFPAADQYTLQGDAFSLAVLNNTEVPVPLEDAIANMAVLDAIVRSAQSNQWEAPVL